MTSVVPVSIEVDQFSKPIVDRLVSLHESKEKYRQSQDPAILAKDIARQAHSKIERDRRMRMMVDRPCSSIEYKHHGSPCI